MLYFNIVVIDSMMKEQKRTINFTVAETDVVYIQYLSGIKNNKFIIQ